MKIDKLKKEKSKDTNDKIDAQLIERISNAADILDTIGESISIQDRTLRIIYQNKFNKDSMGNHVGQLCYKAYPKEIRVCDECPITLTFRDSKVHTVQKELHTNKERRHVEISSSPLKNSKGKTVAAIEVVRDITQRKLAEQRLQQSEARLRAIIEDQTELICRFTPDALLTFVNEAYCRYFGKKKNQLINKSFLKLIPKENQEAVWQSITSLSGKTPIVTHEHQVLKSDGKVGWQQWTNRAIYSKEGTLREYQSVGRDITDRKEAEIVLLKREKELEEKTQSLEELNTALKVLLDKRQDDKSQAEETILINIRELVKPYLEKIKHEGLNRSQETYMEIVESNLDEIISPLTLRMSSSHLNLTPTEIQVVNLIKLGKRSKEIAELINSSPKAIAFHRGNIRKKFGLQNKKINLRAYLLSVPDNNA